MCIFTYFQNSCDKQLLRLIIALLEPGTKWGLKQAASTYAACILAEEMEKKQLLNIYYVTT